MTSRVDFGLGMMTRIDASENPSSRLAEILDQARWAKEAGFTSLWVSQHWVDDAGVAQPVPLLARLAAEAPGLTMGTAIILGPLYPVGILAQELATLDIITGGRLIVGLGAGYRDEEFHYVGLERTGRLARFEESITTLRELWSGTPVAEDGRFYSLKGVQPRLLPQQAGGPALWAGVNGPRALAIAGRRCEEFFPGPMDSMDTIRANQQRFLEARPDASADRRQMWPIVRECFVGETREDALQTAGALLKQRYDTYVKWGYIKPEEVMSFEDVVDQMFIIGSASDCIEQIEHLVSRTGTSMVQLRMQWTGMPHHLTVQSMRRFGESVIPHFAGESVDTSPTAAARAKGSDG